MNLIISSLVLALATLPAYAYDAFEQQRDRVISDTPYQPHTGELAPDLPCARAKTPESPRSQQEIMGDSNAGRVQPLENYPMECLEQPARSQQS